MRKSERATWETLSSFLPTFKGRGFEIFIKSFMLGKFLFFLCSEVNSVWPARRLQKA